MGKRIDLSPYKDEIIERYEGGESATDIAHSHNVAHATMLSRLREWDIKIRKSGWRGSSTKINFTDSQKRKIIDLYNSGKSCKEIANIFDCSSGTIQKRLREKWGVKMRVGGPQRIKISQRDKRKMIEGYRSGKSVHNIAKDLDVNHDTVHSRLKEWGIKLRDPAHLRRKYHFNHSFFSKLNEHSLYFAGLIAADGFIRKGSGESYAVSITSKDTDVLHKFIDAIEMNGRPIRDNRDGSTCAIYVYSKEMYKDLLKMGITERKSLSLNIKDSALYLNRHFIRGYIDGDGHISFNSSGYPVIGLGSGSKVMIKRFFEFIEHIGFRKSNSIYEHKSKNYYFAQISGARARKIIEVIYSDCNVYMNRKYKVAQKIIKGGDAT